MDLQDGLRQRIASIRTNWSMASSEVVRERTTRAAAWLEKIETILSRPEAEFLPEDRDLASFYLFLVTQECIHLLAYWIAGSGWDTPDDAASAFELLADRAAIDRGLATRLRRMLRLRDLISHGDLPEEYEHIQNEYREGVANLRRFLAAVAIEAGL